MHLLTFEVRVHYVFLLDVRKNPQVSDRQTKPTSLLVQKQVKSRDRSALLLTAMCDFTHLWPIDQKTRCDKRAGRQTCRARLRPVSYYIKKKKFENNSRCHEATGWIRVNPKYGKAICKIQVVNMMYTGNARNIQGQRPLLKRVQKGKSPKRTSNSLPSILLKIIWLTVQGIGKSTNSNHVLKFLLGNWRNV